MGIPSNRTAAVTGEQLRRFLASRELSQADLARILDVKRQSVGAWVRGTERIPRRRLAQIALYLDVSINEIKEA